MANILVISPISIAGELILKGFKKGFDFKCHNTVFIDVRELDFKTLPQQNFDFVLSYDYGYMVCDSAFGCVNEIIKKNNDVKIIHYFADNPNLNYALSGDDMLKDKFYKFCKKNKQNIKLVFWDKKYLNEFENIESNYFPICVDCDIYKDLDAEKKYDITFVGRPLSEYRQKILSAVIKNFPNKLKIFSYEKHFKSSLNDMKKYLNDFEFENYKNSFCGFIKSQEELARIYNESEINLNINLQGEESLNYRTFEVLATGGFMLCDKRADIETLGLNDCLVQWEDEKDLIEKITCWLKNKDERKSFGARARKLIYERYNIVSRACEILNIVE